MKTKCSMHALTFLACFCAFLISNAFADYELGINKEYRDLFPSTEISTNEKGQKTLALFIPDRIVCTQNINAVNKVLNFYLGDSFQHITAFWLFASGIFCEKYKKMSQAIVDWLIKATYLRSVNFNHATYPCLSSNDFQNFMNQLKKQAPHITDNAPFSEFLARERSTFDQNMTCPHDNDQTLRDLRRQLILLF